MKPGLYQEAQRLLRGGCQGRRAVFVRHGWLGDYEVAAWADYSGDICRAAETGDRRLLIERLRRCFEEVTPCR